MIAVPKTHSIERDIKEGAHSKIEVAYRYWNPGFFSKEIFNPLSINTKAFLINDLETLVDFGSAM